MLFPKLAFLRFHQWFLVLSSISFGKNGAWGITLEFIIVSLSRVCLWMIKKIVVELWKVHS